MIPPFYRYVIIARDSTTTCYPRYTLQSGGECTKAYLIKGVEQLGAWSANNGENGLLLTTKVILHILDPSLAEFSASFLGSLVIVLIKQVGSPECVCVL